VKGPTKDAPDASRKHVGIGGEEEESMIKIRRWLVLAVVGALASGLLIWSPGHGSATAGSRPTRQLATATFDQDLMVVVTATKEPGGGASPPATVRFAAYRLTDSGWSLIGSHMVGREAGWFWKVLTGGRAVCVFSSGDHPPIQIKIRLLITPSIGCSQPYTYSVGMPAP
jgi:hypothetical protein